MNKYAITAGIAVLLALPTGIALYALQQVQTLRSTVVSLNSQLNPDRSYAMRSIGTGGDSENPYVEWFGFYPESTLYPIAGAPSLRFSDQAPADPDKPRDFEIGFYKYGPTWYTRNGIIEFWIGSGNEDGKGGGIFSVAGNDNGGGEVQVRNPTDTDAIRLEYHEAGEPMISTEQGTALHFSAADGLISDSTHIFEQGITIASKGGYTGRVLGGAWQAGSIIVPSAAVTTASLILITPISQPQGTWWVSSIDPDHTFTVSSSATDESMDFNWWIVGSS